MAKSKQKQMSIQLLKPEVDMYDEFVELNVRPQGYEEDLIVKLFPLFKPDTVNTLVVEYFELLAQCNKEKIEVDKAQEGDILGYLIVKYFTDIKTTKSKKAKTILEEVDLLKNSQLYKEIMELYPKESIASVHNRILELNEAFVQLEGQLKTLQDEYQNLDLENRDVLEAVFQNKLTGDKDEIIQ